MRLFRSRRVRQMFPAGVVAAFIAAVVLAAVSFGSNPSSFLLGTLLIGSIESVLLYMLLKVVVEPRLRSTRH
jgi:hypothetical protein